MTLEYLIPIACAPNGVPVGHRGVGVGTRHLYPVAIRTVIHSLARLFVGGVFLFIQVMAILITGHIFHMWKVKNQVRDCRCLNLLNIDSINANI